MNGKVASRLTRCRTVVEKPYASTVTSIDDVGVVAHVVTLQGHVP